MPNGDSATTRRMLVVGTPTTETLANIALAPSPLLGGARERKNGS